MNKKICIITGSRAEYGLLRILAKKIKNDPAFILQIIATGAHLSQEFDLTYREIESDGFKIDRKVEMLTSSDTPVGISQSMGLGLIGFADALNELQPDLLLVLGDRFEIFSAVSAALIARIPVAHIGGGETTEGVIDEAFRHSITKMSHLHFVANQFYRQRIIQLGENPANVFFVGGLGADAINNIKLLKRSILEKAMDFRFRKKNLLITFHPVTLEKYTAAIQMKELLKALEHFPDIQLIFTMPNADTDGRILIQMIEKFVSTHPNACAYKSLGQLRYLSCMYNVDGVVGNSSSGIGEAPAFKKGTINIGDRQKGRLQASSIINCPPDYNSIIFSINKLYSEDFQKSLSIISNPYGEVGASKKIINILKGLDAKNLIKKVFYDLLFEAKNN